MTPRYGFPVAIRRTWYGSRMLGAASGLHSKSLRRSLYLPAQRSGRSSAFQVGAPGYSSVFAEMHVRAAGYYDDRDGRATDDLRGVRAEEDPSYGSEPARADHEHFAFLPGERVKRLLPVPTADDAGLHRDV